MEQLAHVLTEDENLSYLLLAGVAVIWILAATISGVVRGNARERTKREIAAYIAEGSMTPEQGEKIIKADRPVNNC